MSKSKKLSKQDFLKSFKNIPRIAISLLVSDKKGKILLTRRNIPPFKGFWHLPGSFLLKNETLFEVQKRIAEKEFGLKLNKKSKITLMGVFEDVHKDPRGHVIDIVFGLAIDDPSQVKTTEETSEVKFFERLTEKIGFNHRETLHKLGFKDR